MIVSGTGITSFTAKVRADFRVKTTLAIQWFQGADGNWHYVDRGATVDTYESDVRIYGLKGSVEQLATQINANRTASSNQINLSVFNSNEKIFGADVNHTSVTATILENVKVVQSKLKSFYASMTLRAIAPTFTGTAYFPTLKYLNIGYNGNVEEWTINKKDSYAGTYTYLDGSADAGTFSGTFQFTDTELKNLRRYMATSRGTTTTIAEIYGITNPFGPNRPTYPISVKVLELTNEEQRGIGNWYATLKLGEVI